MKIKDPQRLTDDLKRIRLTLKKADHLELCIGTQLLEVFELDDQRRDLLGAMLKKLEEMIGE